MQVQGRVGTSTCGQTFVCWGRVRARGGWACVRACVGDGVVAGGWGCQQYATGRGCSRKLALSGQAHTARTHTQTHARASSIPTPIPTPTEVPHVCTHTRRNGTHHSGPRRMISGATATVSTFVTVVGQPYLRHASTTHVSLLSRRLPSVLASTSIGGAFVHIWGFGVCR